MATAIPPDEDAKVEANALQNAQQLVHLGGCRFGTPLGSRWDVPTANREGNFSAVWAQNGHLATVSQR
jgi:hypothetical protein